MCRPYSGSGVASIYTAHVHTHTRTIIDRFRCHLCSRPGGAQDCGSLLSMFHVSADCYAWQRRLNKRQHAVHSIKQKPEYMFWLFKKDGGRPKTPDPQDAKVSKRQWESSVQRWRRALQERNHDRLELTVQTCSTLAWLGGPEQQVATSEDCDAPPHQEY